MKKMLYHGSKDIIKQPEQREEMKNGDSRLL